MAKTICPNCGFSPIPHGASQCPRCEEPFDFLQTHKKAQKKFIDRNSDEESDVTTFGGGLTGAVSAHPWPAAIVIALGAGAWFLRAAGMFGAPDPFWTYAIVLLDLVAALMLVINVGPSKMFAQGVTLLQLGAAAYLGRLSLQSVITVAFIAQALVAFTMVLGEPSPVRRYLSLGFGLMFSASAAAAVALLSQAPIPTVAPSKEIDEAELGIKLSLPQGFTALSAAQVATALTVPPPSLTSGGTAFGDVANKRFGVLTVEKMEEGQLVGSCRALYKIVGGRGEPETAVHSAPAALGSPALVYRIKTATGATGLHACGKKPDGRLIALTVVTSAADASGDAVFDAVGAGLSLK
ncbi:MAG: zinc ribbon domain-containing protein [Myxococcaceae bacterium]